MALSNFNNLYTIIPSLNPGSVEDVTRHVVTLDLSRGLKRINYQVELVGRPRERVAAEA